MTDLLSMGVLIIGWVVIGVVTFRILYYFYPPDDDDENLFLGFAVFLGPLFTCSVLCITAGVAIVWVLKRLRIIKLIRKAGGLE